MTPPKVFVSYSWSSPDHEQWVLELASDLVESGVDVVLDKWELREGQDKFAFMERMVTDAAISKVLVISDRLYADKADTRRGGVGTESQIISAEVYDKVDQKKFVPIVSELSDDGSPVLPTYLRGRIYIDMSNAANRYGNFEQLVRWIFDKPVFQKPALGKAPAYITDPAAPQMGTASRFRAAVDAIRVGKSSAIAAAEDYFETFAVSLELLRIQRRADPYDDQVAATIDTFRVYRDEAIDLITVIARYRSDREIYDVVHRWLERLLLFKYPPDSADAWHEDDFDNYKFMLNETYLYVAATLLRARRHEQLRWLMENKYFVPAGTAGRYEARLEPFEAFQGYIHSLNETRNKRLGLRRLSVVSDMLKQRSTRRDLPFDDLMQADFVLTVYSVLHFPKHIWFPNTLIFASHGRASFELFARATSRRGFLALVQLFEVEDKDDLVERFKNNGSGVHWESLWQLDGFDPYELMNASKLQTEP